MMHGLANFKFKENYDLLTFQLDGLRWMCEPLFKYVLFWSCLLPNSACKRAKKKKLITIAINLELHARPSHCYLLSALDASTRYSYKSVMTHLFVTVSRHLSSDILV